MKKLITAAVCAAMLGGMLTSVSAEGDAVHCSFTYPAMDTSNPELTAMYPYEGADSVYVSAWQEETVYLKTAVTADADTHVSASMAPLSGVKQNDQPSASIGLLKPVSAGLGMGNDPYLPHVNAYDRISPKTETDLAAGETAYFWIEITAGPESSGRYDGDVIIHADRDYALHVELVVTPLNLSQQELSVDLWQYPFASFSYYDAITEPFSEPHLSALRKELALYKQAGGNHITCTITDEPWAHQTYYDCPSMVKWNIDGSGNLWFDFSRFDTWVELCESEGLTGPIECFSILPFDNDLTIYDDMNNPFRVVLTPGSEEWRWYWETFLYMFTGHLKEKGWLDRTVMFVDERGIPYFQTAIDLVRSVPDGSQITFAAAVNVIPRDTALYDQIDYLSISIASVPENDPEFDAFLSHRAGLGLTTTLYNCSTNYPNAFATSDPCESVWTMQYLALRGFDGYLRWALNAWPEDPRSCSDAPHFESGDTFLIYPDERASADPVPEPSVRLRMITQGLNDARKYYALTKILPVNDAETLRQVFRSLERYGGTYNAYGAMSAVSDENRASIASQTLRTEEGIRKAALIAVTAQRGNNGNSVSEALRAFLTQYQELE